VFLKHAKVVLSGVHRPLEEEGRRVWSRGIPREDVREDVGEDDRGHARSQEGGRSTVGGTSTPVGDVQWLRVPLAPGVGVQLSMV
jgi:hypothetical protein